jgi:hypothetical protein
MALVTLTPRLAHSRNRLTSPDLQARLIIACVTVDPAAELLLVALAVGVGLLLLLLLPLLLLLEDGMVVVVLRAAGEARSAAQSSTSMSSESSSV